MSLLELGEQAVDRHPDQFALGNVPAASETLQARRLIPSKVESERRAAAPTRVFPSNFSGSRH